VTAKRSRERHALGLRFGLAAIDDFNDHICASEFFVGSLNADTLEVVSSLNRRRLAADGDPEIATRIASYEMAHRLQTSAPELMNLADESPATLALYGCKPEEASFARACLIGRRLVERGVRFVTIYHEGWDAHSGVAGNVKGNCEKTDRASAALVKDLKQRGMLDDTLILWGGEFGRTPMGQGSGRDHHILGFSVFMAGGGVTVFCAISFCRAGSHAGAASGAVLPPCSLVRALALESEVNTMAPSSATPAKPSTTVHGEFG
jgi:hypothetical protein